MGGNKKYDEYKSYQNLEPNVDYKPFKLCKEINRVPSSTVPLSKTEEERVHELLEKSIIISLHDHPEIFPKIEEVFDYIRTGKMVFGFED